MGRKQTNKKHPKKRHFRKDKAPNKQPRHPGTTARFRLGVVHTEASQQLPFICTGMTEFKRPIYRNEA